eukprot:scaffold33588_cov76-Amphora_coffeaeformis.AAC.1
MEPFLQILDNILVPQDRDYLVPHNTISPPCVKNQFQRKSTRPHGRIVGAPTRWVKKSGSVGGQWATTKRWPSPGWALHALGGKGHAKSKAWWGGGPCLGTSVRPQNNNVREVVWLARHCRYFFESSDEAYV